MSIYMKAHGSITSMYVTSDIFLPADMMLMYQCLL